MTTNSRIETIIRDRYSKLDINTIINMIMEVEKRDKKQVSDKWVNDRWYELKTKDRKELEKTIINYNIPELDNLSSEEIMAIDNLLYVYNTIRASLFKDVKDDELGVDEFSQHFIEILENQNTKIDNTLKNLIHKVNDEVNSKTSNILEYVVKVYQFYDNEFKKRYAVFCTVCEDEELTCSKAEIISDGDRRILEKYRENDSFVSIEGKVFNYKEMEFLFDIDLKKYINWNEVTKRAMDDIMKKFPEGVTIVLKRC